MSERINFSITKTEVLESANKDQLAKVRMWIVREGNNLHNLPISWGAIEKAKETLIGKPVLCSYDKNFRMFRGHEKDEIPVGVFLYADDIKEEVDENNQRWLISDCYLWKKYFPHVMQVFKEDHGESAVSMEIDVLESHKDENDDISIDSFSFLGVTLIGVPPAIENAKATVIAFSEMVKETKEILEFGKYDEIDFKIPVKVKQNAKNALEERKKSGRGGTSVSLAVARWLSANDVASPEKIKQINKYFKNREEDNSDPIAWNLMGGNHARLWSTKLMEQMVKKDNEKLSYFSNKDDEKEMVNMEDEKEEVKQEEEMAVEKPAEQTPQTETEQTKEEYAEEEVKKEEIETEEEKKEEDEEDEEESEKEEMSLNAYLDATAMLSFLEEETEAYREMVNEFACDDAKKFNYGKVMGYMFGRMQGMATELNSLREFKASYEKQQFEFAVAGVLEEVRKVGMPKDEMDEWKKQSANYSLESVNAWANACKAAALPFAVKSDKNDDIVRIGLPFEDNGKNKNGSVWDRI